MFGEQALYSTRNRLEAGCAGGAARLEKALAIEGRRWQGRAHLELGKLVERRNPAAANEHLRTAVRLSERQRQLAAAESAAHRTEARAMAAKKRTRSGSSSALRSVARVVALVGGGVYFRVAARQDRLVGRMNCRGTVSKPPQAIRGTAAHRVKRAETADVETSAPSPESAQRGTENLRVRLRGEADWSMWSCHSGCCGSCLPAPSIRPAAAISFIRPRDG